jgi:transposase
MSSNPLLNDLQWRRIERLLPPSRRDRAVIAAILYLEFSGVSLRHAAELFGLSRTRLHEWHRAIEADGSLAKVMEALKLESAGRRGRTFYGADAAMAAEISALRVGEFRAALRGRR